MPLTTLQSLFQFAIANLGQTFAPNCPIQNTSDFLVTYTNATTFVDTVLVGGVDYTVSGAFTAGVCAAPSVTLEPAGNNYAVGGTLTIQRKPPASQPTTYVDGVKYLAAVPNNSLDWLAYSIQALYDIVARCLQVPASSNAQTPIALALRKNNLIGFDPATGDFRLFPYPAVPGPATGLINNMNLIGPTGGGGTHLDGIDASIYAIGTIMKFTMGGIGAGSSVEYQLTTSAAAVGAGVVAALNVPTARWIQVS